LLCLVVGVCQMREKPHARIFDEGYMAIWKSGAGCEYSTFR
jgi:hypothetical protein